MSSANQIIADADTGVVVGGASVDEPSPSSPSDDDDDADNNNASSSSSSSVNAKTILLATRLAQSFPARVASCRRLMSPPRQLQKWGDEQILPHTNWGDLFFDLFYVAAAYNLSYIILTDPSNEGILYFLALMGPIMIEWFIRMNYDARYNSSDDPIHRLLELLHLSFLATAVVHIRTVDVMSHPSEYPDMFAYCLAATMLSVMNVLRYAEIWRWVDGEGAARRGALRETAVYVVQGMLYGAAAAVAGMEYYGGSSSDDGDADRAGDHGVSGSTEHNIIGDQEAGGHESDGHRILFKDNNNEQQGLCSGILDALGSSGARFLANASSAETAGGRYGHDETTATNVPAWLCLGGYIFYNVHVLVMILFCFPGGGRHKKISVPMNIDFAIHRLGEWTMLLLGESVLSLLIVETSVATEYYVTFYAGLISVVLMQYLHFRSQPHHADEHAMRRSKNAGVLFNFTMQIYSFALVAVGVSFKMLLIEYTYEEETTTSEEGHRRLIRRLLENLKQFAITRSLAGGGAGSKYTTRERQQRVANFFCASMAITWVCLDLMILLHQGVSNNVQRCKCPKSKKVRKLALLFAGIRIGLIAFIASLSQYVQQPNRVAIIGMVSIVMQVLTRVSGDMVFPKVHHAPTVEEGQDNEDDEDDEERWPNVTHARAKHVEEDAGA